MTETGLQDISKRECPCCSGLIYEQCCKPYHEGALPENALKLMRSRYSAYALNLPKYIIKTTHPASSQYSPDQFSWARHIAKFAQSTEFKKLEVLEFKEHDLLATVTFVAHMSQKDQDLTFTEKSLFEKVKGKWLYKSGKLAEGHAPNLITEGQLRVLPIAYYGDPILRKKADPILEITDDIRKLVEDMEETMIACNGMGLAAPQVHHSIRLFIVRVPAEKETDTEETVVYINPKLSSPGAETWVEAEACLSIPTIHGDVERPKEITVEYTDLKGQTVTRRVSDWEARIIMHENDHINGVLFIDRVSEKERQQIKPFLDHLKSRIHDGTEM